MEIFRQRQNRKKNSHLWREFMDCLNLINARNDEFFTRLKNHKNEISFIFLNFITTNSRVLVRNFAKKFIKFKHFLRKPHKTCKKPTKISQKIHKNFKFSTPQSL